MDGEVVPRQHQLVSVLVTKQVQRLSSARLAYLDGAAATSDFPLSNTDTFIPGKNIEILAGPGEEPVSLFKGLIIKQSLKIRAHSPPQLLIECRHPATKLTVGRNCAYFFDQTDSDIILALLDKHGVEIDDVEQTPLTHKEQVQYGCTDWDFLLMRAEANGRLVLTNGDKVKVAAPALDAEPVCDLLFGATIHELDATIDARHQYSAVKSISWDPAQQERIETEAEDPGLSAPGNLAVDDLAEVIGLDHYTLRHVAIAQEEAQAWADAQWLRSQMNRVTGRAKCEGIATLNPGDIVNLGGIGERYNGAAFITGVRHTSDTIQGWKSHIQFGGVETPLADPRSQPSAPKAAALLPGVNGLQIAVVVSNEDPEGEHRVRVRMPMVSADEDGTWARVATLDAGEERGTFFRPEVGDEVVLGFLDDDPRQAIILGMLHSSSKTPHLEGSDDNHEKGYQSREGLLLAFNDETKAIRITTPEGNSISLSEEDKKIELVDQNNNRIEMSEDGILIQSDKAIEFKAGTELKMESGEACKIKAGAEFKAEGSSGAELSSTSSTKIKGSLVEIN